MKPAFVRPPFGKYNDLVRQVASVRGQKLVTWDLDAGDGLGKSPAESKAIYDNVAQRRPLTISALNHETHGVCPSLHALCFTSSFFFKN